MVSERRAVKECACPLKNEKKRLKKWLWCGIIGLLLVLFLWEFRDLWKVVILFAVAGAFGVLMTFVPMKQAEKKKRQAAEAAVAAQEKQLQERRDLCCQARYTPAERRTLEVYIERTFDPIRQWDKEEQPKLMPIDVALIPPTEVSPYWRAVTVGIGAYTIWGGPVPMQSELAILLPPDWDPEDKWPMRLLRDTAQNLLVEKNWIGPSSAYRGFSAISAGFAGALLLEDLWNQYPLEPAYLPGGGSVNFYWLFPLLKPEWDYVSARGGNIEPLERRLQKIDPAADRDRPSCCDPLTWLQEDIAPFCWSQDGKNVCLGLETRGYQTELFLRAGLSGTGWDWERLAKEVLSTFYPADGPFVEYACEEWTFFAVSEDEEILRHLALTLHDLCCYKPERAVRLLVPDRLAGRGR